ncbi:DeoR/GlpR family DNA-binding transcription regulator [uncultured Roseovarius sp.]|uniref:DeoR/GlpR family DNA-binding transcription regulator n=1 Tax=uncultured Roseovarius sp. TaxID=293344 RepID=UPI00260B0A1B|nr:DeoR/GlpR family DNA-binding transcription regulator [uncultured Roseovarius sp.]
MPQTFRHPDILEIARAEGKVTVDGLAERFGVSVQTIRRDLTDLARAGRLTRVHGGATLPSGIRNIVYEERRQLNSAAKEAIARTAAQMIPYNACIFLNIGTSTEALARELIGHENLIVATNNINVAQILAANKNCQITLTGGSFRSGDGGLVGEMAAASLENFKFDIAIIGCSGVDTDGELLDFDPQEVIVSRRALERSRGSILLADSSKFTRTAPVRIASISQIDTIISDKPLPTELSERCASLDTEIQITKTDGQPRNKLDSRSRTRDSDLK